MICSLWLITINPPSSRNRFLMMLIHRKDPLKNTIPMIPCSFDTPQSWSKREENLDLSTWNPIYRAIKPSFLGISCILHHAHSDPFIMWDSSNNIRNNKISKIYQNIAKLYEHLSATWSTWLEGIAFFLFSAELCQTGPARSFEAMAKHGTRTKPANLGSSSHATKIGHWGTTQVSPGGCHLIKGHQSRTPEEWVIRCKTWSYFILVSPILLFCYAQNYFYSPIAKEKSKDEEGDIGFRPMTWFGGFLSHGDPRVTMAVCIF